MQIIESDVAQLQAAIGTAYWNLNLFQFCAKLGWAEDDYAKSKFIQFRELAFAMNNFDAGTLQKIIG